MKVDNVRLVNLLEGSRQFVVPRFQRTYSWKKKQWDELWDDLEELSNGNTGREHFMGAIVTMPIDMQPHGVNKFLLIDGQQRLTTILIILACIRDLARDKGQLAEKIDNLYLKNQYSEDRNRHKLLPTQIDMDAFRGVLDGKMGAKSPVSEVYNFFNRKLRQSLKGDDAMNLEQVLETVIDRLVFASIVIDKDDNPYRIFHSLNGTGEDLTQSDLVRNHIFMHMDEDDEEIAYEDYWLPIQQALTEQKELDKFMVDFVLKDGDFVSKSSVYDRIRHETARATNKAKFVQDLLENLAIYFAFYQKLVDPSTEQNTRLRTLISRLNSLRITTPYPLLLNLYRDMDNGRINASEMCDILELIESYLVRRYFCRIHSRGLTHVFISMYKQISRHSDMVDAAKTYLCDRKFPIDEDFMKGWISYPVYGTGIQDRSRFVLEALELHLNQNNEMVDLNNDRITREHIMPRTLSVQWENLLGPNSKATHETYLNTIGNLTLTGENESMGNKPFPEKKGVFARSNFALNEYFRNCGEWDDSAIVKRAKHLGQLALEIWKRPSN